jgi:ABC-type lipoprotein export system ATPase subunit
MTTLLEARRVSVSHTLRGRPVPVLDEVDLGVEAGRVTALVGPSGSGKSSLLRVLGLLAPPDAGAVLVEGADVTGLTDARLAQLRRRKLGFVFQSYNLLPQHSALRNVALPALTGPRDAERRAMELLDEVGLADRARHRPGELSGGEQQRVALARALVNDPAVVLADEPTGNLDQESEERMLGLFRRVAANGCAVLVVTHSEEVASEADTVHRLAKGRLTPVQPTVEPRDAGTPGAPTTEGAGAGAAGGTANAEGARAGTAGGGAPTAEGAGR